MIVLSKKRIIYLISVVMVSFIGIWINGLVYGETNNSSGYTVILDAGHGEPDRRSC